MRPLRCRRLRHIRRTTNAGFTTCHHDLRVTPDIVPRIQSRHIYQTLRLQSQDGPLIPCYGKPTIPDHGCEPTIYALSTAPGRAGIAVIRISGTHALTTYRSLCPAARPLKPRYASVRSLYSPGQPPSPETTLDSNALVLFFPGPASVTGEDVLELHVHGGPAIVKSVLAAIPHCSPIAGSIRYAEPGEFTRRAFMNDRLDLLQVEALGDSLAAETEKQRCIAVRGTSNQLGLQYEQWRQQLLYARGELEALIDFSEDQHFDESPTELISSVAGQVELLQAALVTHTQNAIRGEMLRNGISIGLLGAPNAGKSSLLNRIVGREAAIVSQEAGTTRDVVEVSVDIGGFLCRFGDTAGLRSALHATTESAQPIGLVEQEGIRRAKAKAEESDLVIVVLSFDGSAQLQVDPEVADTVQHLLANDRDILIVVNKADQQPSSLTPAQINEQLQLLDPSIDFSSISLITCIPHDNDGIPSFLTALTLRLNSMTSALSPTSSPDPSIWQLSLGATARQRTLLEECSSHLATFLALATNTAAPAEDSSSVATVPIQPQSSAAAPDDDAQQDPLPLPCRRHHHHAEDRLEDQEIDFVLAAEHLRSAAVCLARITGRSGEAGDVEEVLGVVFEKFCVGK